MIFGGPEAYGDKRRLKLAHYEVNTVRPVVPEYVRWSETPITFDQSNHLEKVPHPETYPLVVEPIIGTKRLSKVLMDGGRGLNILYVETLDGLGVPPGSG